MDTNVEYYESSRLQAFNDAVCAIVATILVLPLRNVEESNNENFVDYLEKVQTLLIVYFVAFLLICSIWESHITRWIVISYVDDVLVWLNITSLLFVSFLPFAVRLVGKYTEKETPVVLSCGILLTLELIEMVMVYYTFSQQKLLRGELRNLLPYELQQKRNYILKRKILNPILYVGAAGLGYVNLKISWVLIILVIITPCINRLLEMIIYRMKFVAEDRHVILYEKIISKERVECFTDGVYAIVATLLVLDITSDNFPKEQDVNDHGIDETLSKMWPEYITYCGTFAVCTLLWFVHHSFFSSVKKVNYLMFIVNNISLACVGSLPFLVSILNKYVKGPDQSDKHAIQFGCFIVGVAGICQFVVFTIALWNSHQYICHHVIPVGAGSSRHNYLVIKLGIIPAVAVIIFACSFSSTYVLFVTYHVLIFLTLVIFILVKFIYVKVFRGQVMIMSVIQDDQPAWTNNEVTTSPSNPGTVSSSYDQYTGR